MSHFISLIKTENRSSKKLTRINFDYVLEYYDIDDETTILILADGKTINVLENPRLIDSRLMASK